MILENDHSFLFVLPTTIYEIPQKLEISMIADFLFSLPKFHPRIFVKISPLLNFLLTRISTGGQ